MKKQKINSYEYIINEEQMRVFLKALQYCRHRVVEHNSMGALSVGNVSYLQTIINEIEKIL